MNTPFPHEPMSPAAAHIGVELVHWAEGEARFELDIAPHHLNRSDIPHGGVYAFMLDTAMSFAGFYTGDPNTRRKSLTLSMNVNFIGQPKGDKLIASAHLTGGGRKTYFAEGRVEDEHGNLVATGQATFKRLPPY